MKLGKLISILEKQDRKKVVKEGFHNPHSYRGYYHELAFEPKETVTVQEMLDAAKSSLFVFFNGYKGGEYQMTENTEVWLAYYGCCNPDDEPFSEAKLLEMLDQKKCKGEN